MGCGASNEAAAAPETTSQAAAQAAPVPEPEAPNEDEWTPELGHSFVHHFNLGFAKGDSAIVCRQAFRVFSTELDRNFIKKKQLYQLLEALGFEVDEDTMKEFDANENAKCEVHEFIKNMQRRKAAGMQPVPRNFGFIQHRSKAADDNEIWWNEELARAFKQHYDTGFTKKGHQKTTKMVFTLFSRGKGGMDMAALYRLLELTGFPPRDFYSETLFREFDRNKSELIESKELVTGMKRRQRAGVPMEPCDFGKDAHIPLEHPQLKTPEEIAAEGEAAAAQRAAEETIPEGKESNVWTENTNWGRMSTIDERIAALK